MNRRLQLRIVLTFLAALAGLAPAAFAQAPAGRGGGAPQVQVTSPELSADRRITFRILAPQAQAIRLAAGDIPGVGQTTQLTKGENGVWEVTIGPIDPGTYRYNFNVDGVTTIDPRSPFISESNNNVWSLVHVPGSDFADTKNVPHGGVAAVSYYSTALGNVPPDARLHAARLRAQQRQVSGLLPAAWRRRQRRLVDVGRTRGFHPRQPDRGEEGQADDRRDARRPHPARPRRAGRRRTDGDRGVREGLRRRRNALYREELPRPDRPLEYRYRRVVDGRQPRAPGRDPAPQSVRLHRRLQLGPARWRVPRTRWRTTRRGAAQQHRQPRRPQLRRQLLPRPHRLRRRPRPLPTGKRNMQPTWTTPASRRA